MLTGYPAGAGDRGHDRHQVGTSIGIRRLLTQDGIKAPSGAKVPNGTRYRDTSCVYWSSPFHPWLFQVCDQAVPPWLILSGLRGRRKTVRRQLLPPAFDPQPLFSGDAILGLAPALTFGLLF